MVGIQGFLVIRKLLVWDVVLSSFQGQIDAPKFCLVLVLVLVAVRRWSESGSESG